MFPSCMNRMYRAVIRWISSFTMEEHAGIIFWGGLVAHARPKEGEHKPAGQELLGR
jgi:hypothetical protein